MQEKYYLDLKKYVEICHGITKEKGFWDDDKINFGTRIALIHSEVSEAESFIDEPEVLLYRENDEKPDGYCIELIDVCIRIFDLLGGFNIDASSCSKLLIPTNSCQIASEHQFLLTLHCDISNALEDFRRNKISSIWAKILIDGVVLPIIYRIIYIFGIDFFKYLDEKIKYNSSQPYKHGKKF